MQRRQKCSTMKPFFFGPQTQATFSRYELVYEIKVASARRVNVWITVLAGRIETQLSVLILARMDFFDHEPKLRHLLFPCFVLFLFVLFFFVCFGFVFVFVFIFLRSVLVQ